jgi:hypothetical protein
MMTMVPLSSRGVLASSAWSRSWDARRRGSSTGRVLAQLLVVLKHLARDGHSCGAGDSDEAQVGDKWEGHHQ